MGNNIFKGIYNIETENQSKSLCESSVYRHPDNADLSMKFKHSSLQSIMIEMFQKQKPTNTIFEHRIIDDQGILTKKTTNISYAKFNEDSNFFGRGILELNLCGWKEEYKDYKLRFLGIYAKNSYQYFVQDMACIKHNIVSVPIYDTLGEEATAFTFTNTNMETLCLTTNHYENMLQVKASGQIETLKNLIIIDEENFTETMQKQGEEVGLNVYMFSEIMKVGQNAKVKEYVIVKPKDIYCFSYTSGTTGTPKGAMLSHENLANTIQGVHKLLDISSKDKHLSYLPFAHIMERLVALVIMTAGGVIGIFGGDMKAIKDDLAIFKPTIFISVPRLFNRFYDIIKTRIEAKTGLIRKIADKAIKTKLSNVESKGSVKHWLYDQLLFKKVKAMLGGKVRFMVTGSAPLNKDVANFMKVSMCCPMIEGYGQTEGTGAEFGMRINDTSSGYVGGILINSEFKLVDVPDMNYTSNDIDQVTGLPTPRGEIWVRGPGVIQGYYKNDTKNKETFTEDGWLMSGDIGMIVPPSNHLVVIDRKKNIFKLSQGEYIAPDKLQGNYKTITPLITDIFIYGNSLKSCVICVVTVEKENKRALAELMGVCKDVYDDELFTDPDYEKALLDLFKVKAKEVKFNGMEIPKGIVFNDVTFEQLDLLTTSFKMKRTEIKDHFLERLEKRYEPLN